MTREELNASIKKGKEIVEDIDKTGCNCIGFGEMGIGNSSSASLIMHAITGLPIEECVGRGTGANDEQLAIKISTLKKVVEKYRPETGQQPFSILENFGGFEIAMMTGAYLKAAELNMVILVDGFISTAALLIARQLYNETISPKPHYQATLERLCFFAHSSSEQGHEKMLNYLHAEPLLNLQMRLGEGTGAALAIPIIQSAVNFLEEMASFESAGVSNKE